MGKGVHIYVYISESATAFDSVVVVVCSLPLRRCRGLLDTKVFRRACLAVRERHSNREYGTKA